MLLSIEARSPGSSRAAHSRWPGPDTRRADRCKRVFLAGLLVLTAARLACGLSGSPAELLVFRVQGVAAGTFVPAITAVIALLFVIGTADRSLAGRPAVWLPQRSGSVARSG